MYKMKDSQDVMMQITVYVIYWSMPHILRKAGIIRHHTYLHIPVLNSMMNYEVRDERKAGYDDADKRKDDRLNSKTR